MPVRPQVQYNLKLDNSRLSVLPSEDQTNSVYSFCHNFSQAQSDFIALNYRIGTGSALSSLIPIETSHALGLLLKEIREEGYCLLDTISDFTASYKGCIGYIIVGFNNRGYLVDALTLYQDTAQFKRIIQDDSITKYCYRLCVVLQDVKREWSAFGKKFFDFELLEKSIGVKKQTNMVISRVLERPLSSALLQELQQRFDTMVKYLSRIRYFLQQEQENQKYSIFTYSNHYELLLKEQHHKILSREEEEKEYYLIQNEVKKRMREDKENNFFHQNQKQGENLGHDLYVQTQRETFTCQLLLHWREHMAKMHDFPSRRILNYHQILMIALQRPTSILEMQNILGNTVQNLEIASKLLQLLSFQSQLNDNSQNELNMRGTKKKEDKNIKNLLSQLKWDGREQWLNRKNDQSIKLYKEIVSIVELDGSVVEQFTEEMNNGIVGNREIGRFVKYAQYLRNGNHKKLKECYDSNVDLESGWVDDEMEGWQSEEEDFFITGKKISKSLTSIASSCQKITDKAELYTLPTIRSPNSFSSLLDLDNKVTPLPENIQEIYMKAASVKKSYQKVQKKKGGRKDCKDQNQQFIPSWQDIKVLLEA